MHLEGNFIKYLPKGQIMIHHGPKKQPKQGAKGGVAIILSPKFEQGWKQHGNIITYGEISIGKTTCYMEVQVVVKSLVKLKTKSYFNTTNCP